MNNTHTETVARFKIEALQAERELAKEIDDPLMAADKKPKPAIIIHFIVNKCISIEFCLGNAPTYQGENEYGAHRIPKLKPHFFCFQRFLLNNAMLPFFYKYYPKQ